MLTESDKRYLSHLIEEDNCRLQGQVYLIDLNEYLPYGTKIDMVTNIQSMIDTNKALIDRINYKGWRKAPWRDYEGNEIFEGSVIRHPSMQRGTVFFKEDAIAPEDQWLVNYDTGKNSRLCLQIGEKGQAVVEK